MHEAATVKTPYVGLGIALVVLAVAIGSFKLPKIEHAQHKVGEKVNDSIWRHPSLIFGAIAIFVYVGAEVSIGSFLVNYFGQPEIGGLTEKVAASFVAFYWGGAMVGRFIGSIAKRRKSDLYGPCYGRSIALILLSYRIQSHMPPGYQPGVPNLTWLAWVVVNLGHARCLLWLRSWRRSPSSRRSRRSKPLRIRALLGICAVCAGALARSRC